MKAFVTDIGTDYTILLFFALLLWRAEMVKTSRDTLVSVEDGQSLRGMAALLVLLHHMAPMTRNGVLLHRLFSIGGGSLAVALFFFLSGYGLQKQYMKNREVYRHSFLKKRIPSILIPWAFFAVLYWLVYYSLGKVYTFANLIDDLRNGIPFVAYSWYLMALLFFYLLFWIHISLFRNHGQKHIRWMPFIGCGWYVLYALICIRLKYLIFWYDTAHLLPVGMFFAVYEKEILQMLKNRRLYVAATAMSAFLWILGTNIFSFGLPMNIYSFYLVSLLRIFSFVMMVILLRQKLQIDNPALRYLGKISMETYLIHGLFYYLLRGDYGYVENETLFCFLGLTGVIVIASFLFPVDRFLLRTWKRAVK